MYKYLFIVLVVFSSCRNEEKMVITQEIDNWKFQYQGQWYSAEVPGNNFSDLLNHNLISDPFYGTNEDSVQWVSENNWIYRSKFSISENKQKKVPLAFTAKV